MTATTAIRDGARRANSAKRIWAIYYLATLFFGIAVALPFVALMSRDLAHTLWAGRMLPNFNLDWIAEFAYKTGGWPAVSWQPAFVFLAVAYWLLATFLAGGIIPTYASEPAQYDSAVFWGACGRNFARLLRLALFAAIFYAIVLAIDSGLAALGGRIFRDSMVEKPVDLYAWSRVTLITALLCFVNLIFDYARVRLALGGTRSAIRAGLGAFRFVLRNFRVTAGPYVIALVLLGLLAFAAHFIVHVSEHFVPTTAIGWLLVMAVLQQLFVFGRIWIKLLFYGSEVAVWGALASTELPTAETQRTAEIAARRSRQPIETTEDTEDTENEDF